MPEKLDRCVEKVKKQGYSSSQAWSICTTSLCYRRGKGGKWIKDTNWCKKYKERRKKKLKKIIQLLFLYMMIE